MTPGAAFCGVTDRAGFFTRRGGFSSSYSRSSVMALIENSAGTTRAQDTGSSTIR